MADGLLQPIPVTVHRQNADVVGEPVERSAGEPLGADVPASGPLAVTMVELRSNRWERHRTQCDGAEGTGFRRRAEGA